MGIYGSRRPMSIYVIEAQNGMCKIGCSTTPQSRAEMVHAHSPVPVRLIATWKGIMSDEFALHRRFEAYRGHSEWFRIEGDLADFINGVRGLNVDVQEWGAITWKAKKERRIPTAEKRRQQSVSMKECWARQSPQMRAQWVENIRNAHRITRPKSTEAA